ncbi:MAG: aspartate carbamoyltransferase catalytic subunit [Cryobacterium sp.]|nr:aspartate carbamoyltransferase catalytic subunit [Oligoflexia bacterium]
MKHLLAAADLSPEEIRFLLNAAKKMAPALKREKEAGRSASLPILTGKTIVNLFFENSTRTRMSFDVAIRQLGAGAMNFAASTSSVTKGETLIDTAKNIEAMGPHAIVVRHSSAGSPHFLSKNVSVPVINAGDGFHEHPTQGLLDLYTMEEKLGTVAGKRVVIMGDIAHSRVARSNIHLLRKMGASVAVCAPPTLLPPSPETLGVDYAYRPEELLGDADVVMCLRIQLERQNRMQIPSLSEYSAFWGLSLERAALLKPGCIILHPGPVNRGVELDTEVADGPRSVILDQVFNGVLVRMAVLATLVDRPKLEKWLATNGNG